MDDIQLRAENIRGVVRAFKADQEALMLKMSESLSKNGSPARKAQSGAQVSKRIIPPHVDNKQNVDEVALMQMVNTDILVMPMARGSGDQRLWPQALTARYNDMSAVLGNIENHGTLWRLVLRQDAFPGCRAHLQATEIGEDPKFLSSSLHLTSFKAESAVWNVRRCVAPKDDKAVPFEAPGSKGVLVALELVDAAFHAALPSLPNLSDPYAPSSPSDLDSYPKPAAAALLTCCTSQLTSQVELSVSTCSTIKGQRDRDDTRHFCVVWELCPEAWINEDLDFLENFLS